MIYKIRHLPDQRHRAIEKPDLCELWVGGAQAHLKRRVEDFLRRQAKTEFTDFADHFTDKLDVTRRRLSLRDTKSRWGSCSSDGTISLSWRLIMAPVFVYRYVVAHEVSHLKYMDHSRAFWATVEELVEERHEAKIWLAQNGNGLYGVGAGMAPTSSPYVT